MEELMGAIKLVAFNYVPRGFLDCNGQILRIDENEVLYSLLGINYGGDGRTSFGLPKMDTPMPGMKYIICSQGIYPSRP